MNVIAALGVFDAFRHALRRGLDGLGGLRPCKSPRGVDANGQSAGRGADVVSHAYVGHQLAQLLQHKQLVAPFGGRAASQRGYYIEPSARGLRNPDAQDFIRWLRTEADVARGAASGAVRG